MKNTCKKFTEKDLAYISDMFSWNMTALKLVNNFIDDVKNEEVKSILEEVFNMHYENLNKCLSILENDEDDEYEVEEQYYEENYEEIDEDQEENTDSDNEEEYQEEEEEYE